MNNTNNKEILEISIEDIIPNRFQPRLTFDVEALNELANSIKEHGIIQPLVVRRLQDKFEIIAGERRYKAATLVGMQKVPCIIMNLNDNESAEVAVIENIQRKEMTPLEEAKSFKKILDRGYLTQEELAKKMGKSQSSIANKLRLLNLDEAVQDAILNNKISERHARSILKISSKEVQRNILSEILEKRLTVKQTDDLINEKYGDKTMNNLNNNNENSIFKEETSQNIENNNIFNSSNTKSEINIPIQNMMSNEQTEKYNENLFVDISDKKEEPNKIFQYTTPTPTNLSEQSQVIENIINPSVFSNDNISTSSVFNNNLNTNINSMDVNVNSLKNIAEDINKKEPEINIDSLLNSNELERKNKFFVDLNVPIEKPQNVNEFSEKKKLIETKINELKNNGIKILSEEKDLGNIYEVILRIEK